MTVLPPAASRPEPIVSVSVCSRQGPQLLLSRKYQLRPVPGDRGVGDGLAAHPSHPSASPRCVSAPQLSSGLLVILAIVSATRCSLGVRFVLSSCKTRILPRGRSQVSPWTDEETEGQRVIGVAGFQPRTVWLQSLSSQWGAREVPYGQGSSQGPDPMWRRSSLHLRTPSQNPDQTAGRQEPGEARSRPEPLLSCAWWSRGSSRLALPPSLFSADQRVPVLCVQRKVRG